jgi:hypothetical protein
VTIMYVSNRVRVALECGFEGGSRIYLAAVWIYNRGNKKFDS